MKHLKPRTCPCCESDDLEVEEAFDLGEIFYKSWKRRRKIYDAACLNCTADFEVVSGKIRIINEGIEMGDIWSIKLL